MEVGKIGNSFVGVSRDFQIVFTGKRYWSEGYVLVLCDFSIGGFLLFLGR